MAKKNIKTENAKAENNTLKLTKFEEQIKQYLDERAEEDELFAKTYAKKNKTIQKCCQYIYNEVRKMAKGGNAIGVADEEVYNLAVHYYDEDNIDEPKEEIKAEVVSTSVPKEKKTRKRNTKKSEPVAEIAAVDEDEDDDNELGEYALNFELF